MQKIFILLSVLFLIGCFPAKRVAERTAPIISKPAFDYSKSLSADYPTLYLSYYDFLTTAGFAAYVGVAKTTDKGIFVEYKDAASQKVHCLGYYKDENLKPIGEWQIFDEQSRLKTKKIYEGDNLTETDFDSLQHITSISYYEDTELKTMKRYEPTGELISLSEYTKIGKSYAHTTTTYRPNKTKKSIQKYLDRTEELKRCFNEKEQVMDCPKDTAVINETKPEYPGGEAALMNFIASNIKYPTEALEANIEGKIYVRFIINRNGDVEHIVPMRYPHPSLMREAVRVVRKMPKWTPGMQNGKFVRVAYTLPIVFKFE
jgi:TonB family protein